MSPDIFWWTMLLSTGRIPGTLHVAVLVWHPTRNHPWEEQACATRRREALWTVLCGQRPSWWSACSRGKGQALTRQNWQYLRFFIRCCAPLQVTRWWQLWAVESGRLCLPARGDCCTRHMMVPTQRWLLQSRCLTPLGSGNMWQTNQFSAVVDKVMVGTTAEMRRLADEVMKVGYIPQSRVAYRQAFQRIMCRPDSASICDWQPSTFMRIAKNHQVCVNLWG